MQHEKLSHQAQARRKIIQVGIGLPDTGIFLYGYAQNRISQKLMPKNLVLTKAPIGSKIAEVEEDFSFSKVYARVQKGLPTPYPYIDFYSITSCPPTTPEFISDLQHLYLKSNTQSEDTCLIMAFSPSYWNKICPNSVEVPNPDYQFYKYYKTNIQILFINKKKVKPAGNEMNEIQKNIRALVEKYGLNSENAEDYKTKGMSQANDDIRDTVLGGRFNDNIETPKDPYSFALNGLIGYEEPNHLGGSYLMAQKIDLNWTELLKKQSKHEEMIGRLKIEGNKNDDSTIFSQNWCPHSHIKHSRVKDEFGNPIEMIRQSKPYFIEDPIPGILSKEKGVFFCGYLNHPDKILKIVKSQFGKDGLIEFFNTLYGNILYVPSVFELSCQPKIAGGNKLKSLSKYHGIDWSVAFPGVQKQSASPYLFYSRAQYLQKMSTAQEAQAKILNPPTPRTLRILSKTFALWQDTWYFDRRQPQMGHLHTYLKKHKTEMIENIPKTDLINWSKITQQCTYAHIPMALRQALAVYVELSYILTTEQYGCRGPIKGKGDQFGAATFHVEPEDILVGGQANLTFGQGKHLLDYMTKSQREQNWYDGSTISEHSGVGHVVPHMDFIMKNGLGELIGTIKKKYDTAIAQKKDQRVLNLFLGSIIALKGMQKYFQNYAALCDKRCLSLKPSQKHSINNLKSLADDLRSISYAKPSSFRQAAQLALSIFICLHITGEPVSIGRLDQFLEASGQIPATLADITPEHQEIIDSFWIKVGEKVNLNKSFFEDHQKWGNLAMGGSSSPYPQGASFNQWGHQVTVGGTKVNGEPAYNSVTMLCLRAARTLPLNAPCLGLRVKKGIPDEFLREATKAILSGGAHPILLNDDLVISSIVNSGNYSLGAQIKQNKKSTKTTQTKQTNKSTKTWIDNYCPTVDIKHARDYSSDGCYEFLISGRCWFCLSGLPALVPLELLLNQGKQLVTAGTRFIHGKRTHYELYPIDYLQKGTFKDFEDHYFDLFKKIIKKNFNFQLQSFGNVSNNWTTSLLNAFTEGALQREYDFYSNGTRYNQFCPQYTGIANLVNSLWHINKLVFKENQLTLEEVRLMLLTNWGHDLYQPFVPTKIPKILEGEFKAKCQFWRNFISRSEQKYGINKEVTEYGIKIARKIAQITVDVFAHPNGQMMKTLEDITKKFTHEGVKFGIQVMPGCGTFENYQDNGFDLGASFDGRLKSESVAEDFSLQPYFADFNPYNKVYRFRDILSNCTYETKQGQKEYEEYKHTNFSSGSVLDFNIDEDFDEDELFECIKLFSEGKGPNIITITTCNRQHIQELQFNAAKDLLRFRMGGWTEFGVAMFPALLNHHIRRIRTKA